MLGHTEDPVGTGWPQVRVAWIPRAGRGGSELGEGARPSDTLTSDSWALGAGEGGFLSWSPPCVAWKLAYQLCSGEGAPLLFWEPRSAG